jgi:hypothetical protein
MPAWDGRTTKFYCAQEKLNKYQWSMTDVFGAPVS